MKKKRRQKHNNKKRKRISTFILLAVFISVVAFGVVNLIHFISTKNTKTEPQIISESQLAKIINVSDLSTFEAVYNGIARVMNEYEPDKVDYYVSYEATVKAGINFEEVKIRNVDSEKKVIIKIPEIKITDVNVDIASLDYIFENEKANTSTVSEEAYKKCIEDVTNESNKESKIYEIAKQNAKNVIEALVKPFVTQIDSEYQIQID